MLKLKTIKFLFVLSLMTMPAALLKAQDIHVNATLSASTIKMGQQTLLTLTAEYKTNSGKHLSLLWPSVADTIISQVEVVAQSKIDTLVTGTAGSFVIKQSKVFTITSFEQGMWTIPSMKFQVLNDTHIFYSSPVKLNVVSVAVDTTKAIKDIKPLWLAEYTFADWLKDNWKIILIIVPAIIIIVGVIYYVRKKIKNKPVEVIPEKPQDPPHVVALQKLNLLKAEKLWQQGDTKRYYIMLAEIIREYIEVRFKIKALEQTTDEILFSFRNTAIDETSTQKLKQLLLLSDLVKFAKEQPLPSENEMSMQNAYDFINGTSREDKK